jgi:hypothetical protein
MLQRFKDRFNELMQEGGNFQTIAFAQEQLETRGLPASEKWHIVENAIGSALKSGEKDEKKLPREADLATLEAFRTYFQALIISEIESLPLRFSLEQVKNRARQVIEKMPQIHPEGFLSGFNRESVLWLEYHIEELRQTGALEDGARRAECVELYGAFLGECIILHYGGTWIMDKGDWRIAFDDQRVVSPFAAVEKQIECGSDNGIERFIGVIPEHFGLEPVSLGENTRLEFVRSLLDLKRVLQTPKGHRCLVSRKPRVPIIVEQLKDQLMAYFGQTDEQAAIAQLGEDVRTHAGTAHILKDGIAQVLDDWMFDCVGLVEGCANRNVQGSERKAREWLHALFVKLFPDATPPPM